MYFRDDFSWLSNMHTCAIEYQGLTYPSVESFFQAMKTTDIAERVQFTKMGGFKAKAAGRRLVLRPNWNELRVKAMTVAIDLKFNQQKWRDLLLSIKEPIIEHNNWHDNFWGSCVCVKCGNKGANVLGKILENKKKNLLGAKNEQ